MNGIASLYAYDFFNLGYCTLRVSGRQVNFIQNRHHLHTQIERRVAIGNGLCFHALGGIDHE